MKSENNTELVKLVYVVVGAYAFGRLVGIRKQVKTLKRLQLHMEVQQMKINKLVEILRDYHRGELSDKELVEKHEIDVQFITILGEEF